MPVLIAKRTLYYAGTRKAGDRFIAPAAVALAFTSSGHAKYAEDEGAEPPKSRRRYKRRDMVAQ